MKIREHIKQNGIYYGIFILMLAGHLLIEPKIDDLIYSEVLDNYRLGEYLVERYHTLNARMVIGILEVTLTHFPLILWRVLDSLVYTWIAWGIGRLTDDNSRYHRIFCCGLLMTWPFAYMDSAGYIATTLNYLWVFAAILFVLLFLKRLLERKVSWTAYIPATICLIYGMDQEQGTVILLGVCILYIGYCLYKKRKVPGVIFFYLVLLFAKIVFICVCPATHVRLETETEAYLPEFSDFGLLRKLELGTTSTLEHFLFEPNVMFAVFSGTLFAAAAQYARSEGEKLVSAVPFAVSLCFSVFGDTFYRLFPSLEYFQSSLTRTGTLVRDDLTTVFPCLVYLAVILTILYCIYMIWRKDKDRALFIGACIVLGFGSRVMMGFSASIWASVDRTFIFLYMAMIFATALLAQMIRRRGLRTFLLGAVILTGIGAYLSFLVSVLTGTLSFQ